MKYSRFVSWWAVEHSLTHFDQDPHPVRASLRKQKVAVVEEDGAVQAIPVKEEDSV